MMKDNKKVTEILFNSIRQDQQNFDQAKLTLATAGLLVALSLNSADYKTISIFGHSAYKITLLLIALTAIFTIAGYSANVRGLRLLRDFVQAGKDDWIRPNTPRQRLVATTVKAVKVINAIGTALVISAYIGFIYLLANLHAWK